MWHILDMIYRNWNIKKITHYHCPIQSIYEYFTFPFRSIPWYSVLFSCSQAKIGCLLFDYIKTSVDHYRCRSRNKAVSWGQLPWCCRTAKKGTQLFKSSCNLTHQRQRLWCVREAAPHASARSATDEWLLGLEGRWQSELSHQRVTDLWSSFFLVLLSPSTVPLLSYSAPSFGTCPFAFLPRVISEDQYYFHI